jgi:phage tail-like protein
MNKNVLRRLALKVHASRTIANDPLQKYKFRVTIPGLPAGLGFQKVNGLSREVAVIEYIEGLYPYTHKLPGRETVQPITLDRGMYASKELEDIYKRILTDPSVRNTMVIEILDRFGESKRQFKLAEAWVSKWVGSDLDAASDDVAIEQITVVFEYFLD